MSEQHLNASKVAKTIASGSSQNVHEMVKRSHINLNETQLTHMLLYFSSDQSYMVLSEKVCESVQVNNKDLEGKFYTTIHSNRKITGEFIVRGSKKYCDEYIQKNELTYSAAEENNRKRKGINLLLF